MTKIDALLRTLDALVNANKSGYRCSSEIDTVIKALLDVLKAPADVYMRPRDGGEVRVGPSDKHSLNHARVYGEDVVSVLFEEGSEVEVFARHPKYGDAKEYRLHGPVEVRYRQGGDVI